VILIPILCQVSRYFWTIFYSLHDPRISSARLQIALHDIPKSLLIIHSSVISIDININSAAMSEYNDAQTTTNANSCPPWFVFRNNSAGRECSPCVCKKDFGDVVICDEKLQTSYLLLGNCMTYNSSSSDEQEYDAISFGGCSYVYNSNLVNHRYIALPGNISDLNGIFCAPINRHGLLCSECIDGFGPSVMDNRLQTRWPLKEQSMQRPEVNLIWQ